MRLVFWCLSWHLRGCEVKMSQACHTIKGNKKKNVHCNPRFGDKMSMYCGALCSLDAAAELLTAPSAEVEITPAGSAGSSNISSRFHPVLCDSLQHMNAAVALLYLAGVSGVHRLDHIQSSSVLFRCPSKPWQCDAEPVLVLGSTTLTVLFSMPEKNLASPKYVKCILQ